MLLLQNFNFWQGVPFRVSIETGVLEWFGTEMTGRWAQMDIRCGGSGPTGSSSFQFLTPVVSPTLFQPFYIMG
jgi:hypothetical protein